MKTLPAIPSLAYLRQEAHELHRAHDKANPEICAVLRCHPRFIQASDADILEARLSLADAQCALARAYGFPSWSALRAHVLDIRWRLDGEAGAGDTEIKEVLCLDYYGAHCACHCRHCFLGNYSPPTRVNYTRARNIVERFYAWHTTLHRSSLSICFRVCDAAMSLSEHSDYLRFRRDHGQLYTEYMPINGLPFYTRQALVEYLTVLRDGGVQTINLTFYGLRDSHDAFAGRVGDFDYLLHLAEVAQEIGLARSEMLFLRRDNASELVELARCLDGLPGRVQRCIGPWDYAGRAIALEAERATAADLDALSADLRRQLTTRMRTEGAWVQACRQQQLPAKQWRNYFLVIDDATVEAMEQEPCGELLHRLREQDARWRVSRPSMQELAVRYGDPQGQQLYIIRDLEHKWLHTYYRERGETEPLAWLSLTSSRVDVKT